MATEMMFGPGDEPSGGCRAGEVCGVLSQPVIERLKRRLDGEIVLPGDPKYEAARKLDDPLFDPHPCMIIYCQTESDIRLCLTLVQQNRVPFTLRAGGHSTAGYSAGPGIQIDVSRFNKVEVDAEAMAVSVQSGCSITKLGNLLDAEQLHLPLGDAGGVCIAGFMQGGGFGLTSRTFGMNSDNVLSVRLMLASGKIIEASETRNRDLWWAVRGGTGGNFGVLLTVRYRVRRRPVMTTWRIVWAIESVLDRQKAVAVMLCLQKNHMRAGPTELNTVATIYWPYAELPNSPPYLDVSGIFLGTVEQTKDAVSALLALPGSNPSFSPYSTADAANALIFGGRRTQIPKPSAGVDVWDRRSRYVARDLDKFEWRKLLDQMLRAPDRRSLMEIDCYGGAINAYDLERSAFIHRNTAFCIFVEAHWAKGEGAAAATFLADWCKLMDHVWNGHIYQNFPSASYPNYRWNYWGDVFEALLEVKTKYDPLNLFCFPQMIAPLD